MTETASSLEFVRTASGKFVLSIFSCAGISKDEQDLRTGSHTCGGPSASASGTEGWSLVSDCASSSISVVSVPFEVTGEGPTISLEGLKRCAECGLTYEVGLRVWESIGVGVDLGRRSIVSAGERQNTQSSSKQIEACGEAQSRPQRDVTDMFLKGEKGEIKFPVDDLSGASRAMTGGTPQP